MWYLYILECTDGSYYTGITNNLERRMLEHRDLRGCKYTKAKGFLKLLYKETFKVRELALAREKQIKNWSKGKKKALINNNIDILIKLSH